MKALVGNCSPPYYNLGAHKLADWLSIQGYQVTYYDGDPGLFSYGYDLVALSVIFSWDAPTARDIAVRVKSNSDVWAGGPGLFALGNWWKRETGLDCVRGLDPRFDHQRGVYQMTFASRGCSAGCSFCIVPRMEGKQFSLDWDFRPAPYLMDNNLSALPVDFQTHIVQRYRETGVKLVDAQEGFSPAHFDEATYERWSPILHRRAPWRLGFDTLSKADAVQRMLHILRDVSAFRKRVYVLIGNEPVAACHERIMRVIAWGAEPHVQPLIGLASLTKTPIVRHDWGSIQQLKDMARWANRKIWRSGIPLEEYRPRVSDNPPFEHRMIDEVLSQ